MRDAIRWTAFVGFAALSGISLMVGVWILTGL